MKRWNRSTKTFEENRKIDEFLAEVIEVCKKHGMSISHEDGHGSFIIENYYESNIDWMKEATDGE